MSLRIAIIANGTDPATPGEQAALRACDHCICCDRLPPEGAPPLLQIVGDMDTLCANLPANLITDLHDDQETNDLTKAIRWAQQHAPTATLHFFAVTGKREDHTLANLALISELGTHAEIFTPAGHFILLPAGHHHLSVTPGTPISLLSFTPQYVTAHGLQWPVDNLLLDSLWRATLNRCSAPTLTLHNQAPLYIYQPRSTP